MAETEQLSVNSQIPSSDPVTPWLTGKSCCVKSTRKLGNHEESQETTSDKTPLNKHAGDLQMQEGETAKDFCDKIWLFLQKRVSFSQAGKGDRQTEVIALTTAIRADSEQEAYLAALPPLGSNPSKIDMQIGLCCFKILFPLCYLLSSLTYLFQQPGTRLAISPYPPGGMHGPPAHPRHWYAAAQSSSHPDFGHLGAWREFALTLNTLCQACLGGKEVIQLTTKKFFCKYIYICIYKHIKYTYCMNIFPCSWKYQKKRSFYPQFYDG